MQTQKLFNFSLMSDWNFAELLRRPGQQILEWPFGTTRLGHCNTLSPDRSPNRYWKELKLISVLQFLFFRTTYVITIGWYFAFWTVAAALSSLFSPASVGGNLCPSWKDWFLKMDFDHSGAPKGVQTNYLFVKLCHSGLNDFVGLPGMKVFLLCKLCGVENLNYLNFSLWCGPSILTSSIHYFPVKKS